MNAVRDTLSPMYALLREAVWNDMFAIFMLALFPPLVSRAVVLSQPVEYRFMCWLAIKNSLAADFEETSGFWRRVLFT